MEDEGIPGLIEREGDAGWMIARAFYLLVDDSGVMNLSLR
jgi:hypothetical protein